MVETVSTVAFSGVMGIVGRTTRYKDYGINFGSDLSSRGRGVETTIKDQMENGFIPTAMQGLMLDDVDLNPKKIVGYLDDDLKISSSPDIVSRDDIVKLLRMIEVKMRSGPRDYDLLQAMFALTAARKSRELVGYSLEYFLYYKGSESVARVVENEFSDVVCQFGILCEAAVVILAENKAGKPVKKRAKTIMRPKSQMTIFGFGGGAEIPTGLQAVESGNSFYPAFEEIMKLANSGDVLIAR